MSTASPVTLSVTMCNYNHARFLPAALEAVVAQSRRPDEFIIVDDASTDESVEIIQRCAAAHPWIRLVQNERNLGANASIERALALATGTHLYSGSADDFVRPGFFASAMAMAARHPAAGIVAGQWILVDERGQPFADPPKIEVSEWKEAAYIPPERYLREYLLRYSALHTLSLAAIYNRRCLLEVGGFRRELGSYCDTFAINAISLKHGCCYLPEVFAAWRQLPQSWSHTTGRNPRAILDVRARCVWLMRHSDLKDRFQEPYIQAWSAGYLDYARDTALGRAGESHHRWQCEVFTTLPRRSPLDRAVWWAAGRLSLASRDISLALLRRGIETYEGDTSCYVRR